MLPPCGARLPCALPLLLARAALAEEEVGEITVWETRSPNPSETSASLSVVEVDERLPASAGTAEALDQLPGTAVSSLGGLGAWSGLSVRGSSIRQVQIYIDGVPLNPDGSSAVNLAELPLQAFSRVELWRSLPPPTFGAAPIGGVVNLVTAPELPPKEYRASAGSWHTGVGGVVRGAQGEMRGLPIQGLLTGEILGTRADYPAFNNNNTIYNLRDDHIEQRANNDKSQLSAIGWLRMGSGPLRLRLLDSLLRRDEGLPGHVAHPAKQARLHSRQNLAVAQVEHHGDEHRWSARLWWLGRLEGFEDPAGEIGTASQDDWSEQHTLGLHSALIWAPSPWLSPSMTLQARRESTTLERRLTDELSLPRVRNSASAALAADMRWQDLTLSPVLQWTGVDSQQLGSVPFEEVAVATGQSPPISRFDPRAGLLWQPLPWMSWRLGAGRYLRPPDMTELFGDRGAMHGNPQLRPEQGRSVEAGLSLEGSQPALQGRLDLAVYQSRTEDLIVWVQNGQQVMVPVNIGGAQVRGLELGLNGQMLRWADLSSSLSWTLSENQSPQSAVQGRQLPRVPALELSLGPQLHWEERLRLGHQWSYTDGNYWDATNWYRAAPRGLHSAFVRVWPTPRWPTLELSVLNIADRIAEVVPRDPLNPEEGDAVSAITDFTGSPLPGRTFFFTMTWAP